MQSSVPQGDGEVAGTAIEMDADVLLTTRVIEGAGRNLPTPRYEGPSSLLDIPSTYACASFSGSYR